MTRTILIVDDDASIRRLIATTLEDVSGYRLEEAGDGAEAVDRSYDGLPFFGSLAENVFYGAGYSGNGVVPSLLGGRILRSLVLGRDDEWSRSALARGVPGRFPVEPALSLGGVLVREAVRRKEALEDAGRRPDPLTVRLAALAPSGFFKVSKE